MPWKPEHLSGWKLGIDGLCSWMCLYCCFLHIRRAGWLVKFTAILSDGINGEKCWEKHHSLVDSFLPSEAPWNGVSLPQPIKQLNQKRRSNYWKNSCWFSLHLEQAVKITQGSEQDYQVLYFQQVPLKESKYWFLPRGSTNLPTEFTRLQVKISLQCFPFHLQGDTTHTQVLLWEMWSTYFFPPMQIRQWNFAPLLPLNSKNYMGKWHYER